MPDAMPGANRATWRTWTGWILTCFAVALVAVVVDAEVAQWRDYSLHGENRTVLARTMLGFGPVAATSGLLARLSLRAPGPWRGGELGVALGSGSVALVALLGVLEPATWFFAWIATLPLLGAVGVGFRLAAGAWWFAALTGVVVAGAALGCRAWRRRGDPTRSSRCGTCVLGIAYVTFCVLVLLLIDALPVLEGAFEPVPL